jgi:hypothetical protein
MQIPIQLLVVTKGSSSVIEKNGISSNTLLAAISNKATERSIHEILYFVRLMRLIAVIAAKN